jgi:hypothetical protein
MTSPRDGGSHPRTDEISRHRWQQTEAQPHVSSRFPISVQVGLLLTQHSCQDAQVCLVSRPQALAISLSAGATSRRQQCPSAITEQHLKRLTRRVEQRVNTRKIWPTQVKLCLHGRPQPAVAAVAAVYRCKAKIPSRAWTGWPAQPPDTFPLQGITQWISDRTKPRLCTLLQTRLTGLVTGLEAPSWARGLIAEVVEVSNGRRAGAETFEHWTK